jgi:hypothetical protein
MFLRCTDQTVGSMKVLSDKTKRYAYTGPTAYVSS